MRAPHGAAVIACTALLLTGTACSSNDPAPVAVAATDAGRVRLYGADGNMSDAFGAEFDDRPGLLSGMKGTAPLTRLPEVFKSRLWSVNPDLREFSYAAEAYDAVVISALAAELANTTRPRAIASRINGVTTGGEPCDAVPTCLELAREGQDLRYRGVSLWRSGFTEAGEPSTASYATLHFGTGNRLDPAQTEFVGAGDETAATTKPAPGPEPGSGTGGPLRFGGLLPLSGALADRHPPMLAGAQLAVQEVNAAGGVLGQMVQWYDGDDGTDPAVARRTIEEHVANGVQVIIGPGASGVTRAVLPDIVKARRVLFSPSNTAEDLTGLADEGLYFRTAPPDRLQAKALADVILRDGGERIAVVARDDPYGRGLQAGVQAEVESAVLGMVEIRPLTYPANGPNPPDITRIADQLASYQPDGILIIGFTESAALVKALDAAGLKLRR